MPEKRDDQGYAETLLVMLQRDCDRLEHRSHWEPIVLGMADEVWRQAENLKVSAAMAQRMRQAAQRARAAVRSARQPTTRAG